MKNMLKPSLCKILIFGKIQIGAYEKNKTSTYQKAAYEELDTQGDRGY